MLPIARAGSWNCVASATGASQLKTRLGVDGVQQVLLFRGKNTTYVVVVSAEGRTLLSLAPSGNRRAETNRDISASDLETINSSGGTNILRVQSASLQNALAGVVSGGKFSFEYTDESELKLNGQVVALEESAAPAGSPSGSPATEVAAAR